MVAMRQRKIKQKIINDFLAYLLRLLDAIVRQYKVPAEKNVSPAEEASFIGGQTAQESEWADNKSSESKHPSLRSVASVVTFTTKLKAGQKSVPPIYSNIGGCKPASFIKSHGHKGELLCAHI